MPQRLDAETLRVLGNLSLVDIERYLLWRRTKRRPGWVLTALQGLVQLASGQRWGYIAKEPLQLLPSEPDGILPLTLVSNEAGEVVFRPADSAMADRVFPLQEGCFKGKPVMTRDCPFLWVEERQAKGSAGKYQAGDLVCNEAWTMWERMHLHTDGVLVPDI